MPLPSTLFLPPLSFAYGAVMRARLALYRAGLLKTYQIAAPVISVGNLTAGGTGKTPLVAWLARHLADAEMARVCILTRGYGRANASRRVVVSDGHEIFAGAREGGDEPRLLAEMLLEAKVAVISDADRVAAARWAREVFQSEVFILDDGFQHLRVARNLNIVTVDAMNPWGGNRLLPHGMLREPLRELARADLIIITRADDARDIDGLLAEARQFSDGRAVILTSQMRTQRVRPLLSSVSDPDFLMSFASFQAQAADRPLAAFCAIGNGPSFFAHLTRDGHTLNYTRAFNDHHIYTQSEIDSLVNEAQTRGAQGLLTTAKDAVKLRSFNFSLPCFVVEIALKFDQEDKLRELVRKAIKLSF